MNEPGVVYFKSGTYSVVDGKTGTWMMAPVTQTGSGKLPKSYSDYRALKLRPFSKKGETLPVLLPEGYVAVPKTEGNSEVWMDETGNYLFRTDQDEFEIQLIPQKAKAKPLTPLEKSYYLQSSGISLSEWPMPMQMMVRKIKEMIATREISPQRQSQSVAELLSAFIRKEYLYAMDKVESEGGIAMAHHGAFQCDGAATILTTVLREEFGIPTRICGGFQGSRHPSMRGHSHVVTPAIGHAWVEISDENGVWQTLDPTPTKKTRPEKKGDSDKDDWQNNHKEQEEQEDSSDGDAGAGKGSGKESSEKTLGEVVEEFKQKKAEEARKSSDASSSGGDGKGSKEGKAKESEEAGKKEETPDEIQRRAEGVIPASKLDQVLKQLKEGNPLVGSYSKQFLEWAFDPILSVSEKLERMSALRSVVRSSDAAMSTRLAHLLPLLDEGKSLFVKERPNFKSWLAQIATNAPKGSVNKLAEELTRLKTQLEFTLRFLRDNKDKAYWLDELSRINRVLSGLTQVRHKDSRAIQIARELYANLPGDISKKVLRDRFGLKGELGVDPATASLAKEIVSGHLDDFRMMSILGPHTEFLTDPIPRSAYSKLRTWQRSRQLQEVPETMLSTDPRDKDKWINFAPHLSREEAFRRGQVGISTRRRSVTVPGGREDTDPEKATVILFDTSGSMQGARAEFMTNYLGAFVDRALSDVGRDGKARHRVYLAGFGEQVHTKIEVTSREEAERFLRTLKEDTGNTGSGTDIQKALIDGGAALIEEANQTGKKALARANVILFSDGGSEVDIALIKNEFDRVKSKKTQLMLGFAAIGDTNAQLMDLANESGSLGADRSMYIEWLDNDIANVNEKIKMSPEPVNDFFTASAYAELPSALRLEISRLGSGTLPRRPNRHSFPYVERLKSKIENSRRNAQPAKDQKPVYLLEGFRYAILDVQKLLDANGQIEFLENVLEENHSLILNSSVPFSQEELGIWVNILKQTGI